jgi:Tol biopolymer transport system component
MIDEHDVREMLQRRADTVSGARVDTPKVVRRARRRLALNGAVATVAAAAIAVATFAGIDAIRSAPIPADDPSEELGIFAPVAGRVVYVNDGADRGYDPGLWAVDPSGPADALEGASVAGDVASTLVRLDLEDAVPLDWSSDGTELLLKRTSDDLFPEEYLYVLHADGSETQLNERPMYFGGATISPDGSRVVFARQAKDVGLYVVDTAGGRPVRIPHPRADGIVMAPTFSPDGTQIAYLDVSEDENHVWVMDAEADNAHEILTDQAPLLGGPGGLQWSPAGDRLAMQIDPIPDGDSAVYGDSVIFIFAPDGSDFTQVITGGLSPYWSPDGSQIAYTIECDPDLSCGGLAIADADGSNIRGVGFAASGPWHPGTFVAVEPQPDPILRGAGEVLLFTGTAEVDLDHNAVPGDLVAVDPATGEERVLVKDLDDVSYARWSADGRWVAFERGATRGREIPGSLWVVDGSHEPRQVFDGPRLWAWSSTGARLAVIHDSTLSVVDPSTGRTTELASTNGDVTSAPAWSPDGTRIVFGARGGSISSVDAGAGEPSQLVRLPGENLDSVDGIEWSPDGSRLLILYALGNGDRRLVVMNADGSDIAVLAEGEVGGFDWSPDGSRIAFTEALRVFVAPADGSTPSLVASLPNDARTSSLVWSPDGSQISLGAWIAFLTEDAPNLVIDANGSGDAVPLDDLTYESWRGGSYDCDCDIFG